MKLNTLVSILLILLGSFSFASNTVIKGKTKGFKGKEITVYTPTDYITQNQNKLGFTSIKSDGEFQFNFDTENTIKISIKIEDKTTWFFVEPGKVYNISLSYDEAFNKGRVYDKQLSLRFNFPAPNELNQQVQKFNEQYDIFFEENKSLFELRNRKVEPKIKTFGKEMLTKFSNETESFISNYISYSIASILNSLDVSYNMYTTGKGSEDTKANLYLKYLNNKKVRYYNSEYMLFFKDFFTGEFKKITLEKAISIDVSNAVNDAASFSELSMALSKFPFLKDKEFRELFLINGLKEVYNDKYFKQKNIIKILEAIQSNSQFPEQKIIAENVIKRLTIKAIAKGQKAPPFTLKNNKEELISLSDFKGKNVYLSFFTTWSIPAQREMKIIESLQKKYKGKITFVSICADNDYQKMATFLKENSTYNWTFLHIANDKHLTEKYEVRTFPTYFLINKEGVLVKAPAGRPGGTAERASEENIEKDFYNLSH
jgi:peroxiredoxin